MKPVNSLQRSLLQAVRLLTVVALILSLGVAGSVYAAGPDLTVQVLNSGDFIEGGTGSTYTVTVTNVGDTPTSGLVTMDFNLNATYFTATAIGGTGWNCDLGTLTCTRSDALGGGGFSYPAITITVNVANDTPETVDNDAGIFGGGDVNGDNNVDFDTTNIEQVADLTIEKTHSPVEFVQGEQGAYTITVTNDGDGPTTGLVTVTEILPEGLTAVSFDGTGWNCSLATLVCTRSDALAAGASHPAITLTVSVNLSANDPEINEVFVDGGGELNTANNNSVDVTDIKLQPDVRIVDYELLDANDDPLVGNPQAGDNFKVKLSVQNQGGADTPGVFYRSVYVDGIGDYMPGDPNDDTDYEFFSELEISTNPPYEYAGCLYYDDPEQFISKGTFYTSQNFLSLPAGVTDSQNSVIEISGLEAGTYDLYFYADPTCLTAEINENNNSYGPITVTVGATIPVNVNIAGSEIASYNVPILNAINPRLGQRNGPLQVVSPTDKNFVTSQRTIFGNSFFEVMGIPNSQITTDYWFAWYDDVLMRTWLVISNASASQTANVNVYIGGNVINYQIPPNGRVGPRLGYRDGPLRVVSTNGVPIMTSERTLYGATDDLLEIYGIPANQITNDYWYSWYDDILMQTWLVVSNTSSSQTANVQIHIGGNILSYAIPPNGRIGPRLGYRTGPVRVVSTNGVNILTSQRTLYNNGVFELKGTPANQITSNYWYPWYDDQSMQTWLVIANTSATLTANVEVRIAGDVIEYQIAPGSRVGPRLGYNTGPMQVISTNGIPILTSQRVLYGVTNDLFEIFGIPFSQVTSNYLYPWYDDVLMQTELILGAMP